MILLSIDNKELFESVEEKEDDLTLSSTSCVLILTGIKDLEEGFLEVNFLVWNSDRIELWSLNIDDLGFLCLNLFFSVFWIVFVF